MIYDIFPFKDFNPSLIPRLQENFRRIQHAFNHLQSRYFQREPIWDAKQDPIFQGPTPPENPKEGTFWLDTSQTPNVLYRWSNGQWIKATPTEAGEVGAEKAITKGPNPPQNPSVGDLWIDTSQTPNVLHVWNGSTWVKATPTSPEDVGAEPRIARGPTPPSNPTVDAIWIDTSVNPPVWKRWTGSAWEKMTRTDFAELYGQITGEQIAPDSITPTHIAWLDASLITTGTMLFNRVRGGTVELGGSGNGNGLLIVRDASNNEVARVDNTGMQIQSGSYRLVRGGAPYRVEPIPNLVKDHSFELVPIGDTTVFSHPTESFYITTIGTSAFGWRTGGGALIAYDYLWWNKRFIPYGRKAVCLPVGAYTEQDVQIPGIDTYTLSFDAWPDNSGYGTAGNLRVIVRALDRNRSVLSTVVNQLFYTSSGGNRFWIRINSSALPSNTTHLLIRFECPGGAGTNPVVFVDGVQLVRSDYPVLYDPEDAVFGLMTANYPFCTFITSNSEEHIYIDQIISRGSIRLQRIYGQSIPTSTVTPIVWEGRQPGYNSFGFWDPNQPDRSRINIISNGKYMIIANVRWETNPNGFRMVGIYKSDGSPIAKTQVPAAYSGNSATTSLQVSTIYHFNSPDWFQIVVWQNSGSTLNISPEGEATHLVVYKIGE